MAHISIDNGRSHCTPAEAVDTPDMRRYRITADDPSDWGSNVTNDTIIDDDELDRLAYEWRMDDETVAACRIRLLQDLEEI